MVEIAQNDSAFRILSKVVGELLPRDDEDQKMTKLAQEFARLSRRCRTREDVIRLAREYVALNFVE